MTAEQMIKVEFELPTDLFKGLFPFLKKEIFKPVNYDFHVNVS